MSKANILIVEDELLIAKNTARKLKKIGYDVPKIVSSGQAAIDYISKEDPDLILMDIAIKGAIDGIDTALKVKSKKNIPVIFLTAYASDETLERAAATGCYGYLIKPFRDKELQATIQMALSKHQEQSLIQKSLQDTVNQYSSQLDDIYLNDLTNLPNKLFLRDSFDYLVSSLDRNNDDDATSEKDSWADSKPKLKLLAIYSVNLERFERICSFLSREQRNTLVKEIAQRLTDYVGSLDFQGIAVYIKEDHFVIMIPLDKQITGRNYGQEILKKLRQAFNIEDREIFISASIGISFYPSDSLDIEELLQQGEKAVEYAKSQGGNRCQTFTFAFNIKNSGASENLNVEAELHYALERKEFELYYQPKISLETNSIVGAEALVRWNHPTRGRLTPSKFIHIAEETGLIKPIGEWILLRACKQTKKWHDAGLNFLKIGVNLSGVQFKQSDLFHQITQTLFASSLEPQHLELELTETILIENIKINIQKLNLIKKIGVQIALDDFGTGYSSLSYLQQFPFDTLKIDSCFIRNIERNEVNAVITKTIIEMARKLGLKVVAEGVETEAELKFLQECQCHAVQGFLYSRPLIASEFQKLALKHIKTKIDIPYR